jgi:hypothetical protein
VLLGQSRDILNSIFALDSAAESALMIASHFARLSPEFGDPLRECGVVHPFCVDEVEFNWN